MSNAVINFCVLLYSLMLHIAAVCRMLLQFRGQPHALGCCAFLTAADCVGDRIFPNLCSKDFTPGSSEGRLL